MVGKLCNINVQNETVALHEVEKPHNPVQIMVLGNGIDGCFRTPW